MTEYDNLKDPEKCPECGAKASAQKPSQREGKKLIVHFRCEKNHEYVAKIPLK